MKLQPFLLAGTLCSLIAAFPCMSDAQTKIDPGKDDPKDAVIREDGTRPQTDPVPPPLKCTWEAGRVRADSDCNSGQRKLMTCTDKRTRDGDCKP